LSGIGAWIRLLREREEARKTLIYTVNEVLDFYSVWREMFGDYRLVDVMYRCAYGLTDYVIENEGGDLLALYFVDEKIDAEMLREIDKRTYWVWNERSKRNQSVKTIIAVNTMQPLPEVETEYPVEIVKMPLKKGKYITCPNCNKRIKALGVFCPLCGRQLEK
jgi:hypothetical protein